MTAAVALGAALVVLGRIGVWGTRLPAGIFHWVTWVLVGVLVLVALNNAVGGSAVEALLLAPITLALAALCGLVAASRPRRTRVGG